jgi:hypothetical protein
MREKKLTCESRHFPAPTNKSSSRGKMADRIHGETNLVLGDVIRDIIWEYHILVRVESSHPYARGGIVSTDSPSPSRPQRAAGNGKSSPSSRSREVERREKAEGRLITPHNRGIKRPYALLSPDGRTSALWLTSYSVSPTHLFQQTAPSGPTRHPWLRRRPRRLVAPPRRHSSSVEPSPPPPTLWLAVVSPSNNPKP